MSILVTILIYCVVFAIAYWIVSILPIPATVAWLRTVLYILLGLIAIVLLLGLVGVHI